jgi:putative NADPH-quinone reductase
MTIRTIVIIQGHPDAAGGHFGHALAQAYLEAARAAGHRAEVIDVAHLDFPVLRSKEEFERGVVPPAICAAQAGIERADHLVILFPLWLGTMPSRLQAFFEQVFRPEFVQLQAEAGAAPRRRLKGKSARIVVTMGMPALAYRWFFGGHGVRNLRRDILGFCGIGPVRESLIGGVENADGRGRARWLARLRTLGRVGA